jgi:hypothetical protein
MCNVAVFAAFAKALQRKYECHIIFATDVFPCPRHVIHNGRCLAQSYSPHTVGGAFYRSSTSPPSASCRVSPHPVAAELCADEAGPVLHFQIAPESVHMHSQAEDC